MLSALLSSKEVAEALQEAGLSAKQLETAVEAIRGAGTKVHNNDLIYRPSIRQWWFLLGVVVSKFYGRVSGVFHASKPASTT